MRIRILIVGALLVVVGLVVVSIRHGTGGEKPPLAEPVAGRAVRQPAAPGAAPAARRSEAPAPVAPVPRIDGAVRLPSTEIYENAANLKELADALELRVAAGDAEAARSLLKVLDECLPVSTIPDYLEQHRRWAAGQAPDRRSANERHVERLAQRCGDLVRTGKVSRQHMREIRGRGLALDDLVALAQRIAEEPAAMSAAERTDALRRIVASRNGEAIFIVADAMAYVDDAGDGVLPGHSGSDIFLYAWKLVGCDFGAPCGPDSAFVRNACISIGFCTPGGYREYIRYFSLSPYSFEITQQTEREMAQAIADGRFEVFFRQMP